MALSRRFAVALLAVTALVSGLAAPSATATVATPPTPVQLRQALVGDAEQLVIVSTTGWSATSGKLTLYELQAKGWKRIAGPYYARLGRNGTSPNHVEGDGTTPAGSFPLVSAFGLRNNPVTKLTYRKLAAGDCWISDAARPDYNTLVVEQPCGSQNEDLYSIARRGPYVKAIVTGYNMAPVEPGKGSAIFLHLHSRTRSGATRPTSGCVTLTDYQLTVLLKRIDPAKNPRVVIGPGTWLRP